MRPFQKEKLPADVYIPFVHSLFADAPTLLVGGACSSLTAAVVFLKNGHPVYAALAVGLLLASILRYVGIRKFLKMPLPQDYETARKWEFDYLVRGTIQGVMFGLYCMVAIYLVPDELGEIASVGVALSAAIGIVGRNYASDRMVLILALTMTLPMSIGMIMRGVFFDVAIGVLFLPFFLSIVQMAARVREAVLALIRERKVASELATRFNRALNTMSHGLIMLGPQGRVVVANAEAAALLSVRSPDNLLGRSLKALLRRGVAGGLLSMRDSLYVETQLTRALREKRDRKLLVSFKNGRHFEFSAREGDGDLGVITFEDVTSRVAAEEKVRYMARYDSLTALPNRAYFHEMVSEFMRGGDPERFCALAVLDLDDFKNVNDTLGHPVGDGLIYAVAERLMRFAGDELRVSRFGGDEFMVYFDKITDDDDLAKKMEAIFAAFDGDVDVAGHMLRIQASAGAVVAKAGEADVDGMIVKADLALYKAKERGKNGWQLFERTMDAAFRKRQMLKADLRNAVYARSLRVVYQPIVEMATMRIVSCEALCRWDHSDIGPVSPGIFIPLAEEMGIIHEISSFMLETACRECARWPDPVRVSINLSAKDFISRDIIAKVKKALAASGLSPCRLEVEVTETALLDDKSSTRLYLEELKELGVRIALDDFGTGYSSLSYLHTLPLDKIKIDQSFLRDINTNERSLELLKGTVALSRQLGLEVTVEGVETFEQLKTLASAVKPDLVQGFLFGAALSASGIETMSNTVWPFAADLTTGARKPRRASARKAAGACKPG